jgi:hypothetical protein
VKFRLKVLKKSFTLHSGCRKTCSDKWQHSGYFRIAMGKNYVDLPPVWLLARQQQHGFDQWLFKVPQFSTA